MPISSHVSLHITNVLIHYSSSFASGSSTLTRN